MKPVVDGLANEANGRYVVKVMDLSKGDASMEQLANELGVQYVPTFVFVNSDGSKADQVVGAMTKEDLQAKIAALK